MHYRTIMAAILALAAIHASQAATQGALAKTSYGSARISVTKPIYAEIQEQHDLMLQNLTKTSALGKLCVYSATGRFAITASGNGPHHAFMATDGSKSLPYHLSWVEDNTTRRLTPDVPITSAQFASNHCSAAQLKLELEENAMHVAMADKAMYGGELTLLVTPY